MKIHIYLVGTDQPLLEVNKKWRPIAGRNETLEGVLSVLRTSTAPILIRGEQSKDSHATEVRDLPLTRSFGLMERRLMDRGYQVIVTEE